ncbi:MAG TPA: histidine--tRNA ligase [Bacteroidales bacterium]|nr:MAG: histidine--tRNA ligase [Bacteroidetes bacterium GWF2_33_38]HBF89476.1 histidine--tRNA ligase [Bacteroidales bacterium]
MSQKPAIPKGTRDFIPQEMIRRNYIFDTIKSVFQQYGFLPIETPAMENLSTLMGKYGEEGDKLLFKILDSGDYLKKNTIDEIINVLLNEINFTRDKLQNEILSNKNGDITEDKNKLEKLTEFAVKGIELFNNSKNITLNISEKGLRYDLTVPFARFVVQHQNEITFPFKRYQIQPVWRADRPQKGRYREFYQCDVDVVGSDSLINEVELIQIVDNVFEKLNVEVTIKINNRKILSGIAEIIGEADKIIDITVAIDKLDKIGLEKVNEELSAKGISEKAIAQLQPIINLSGTNVEKIADLKSILSSSTIGQKGIAELEQVFKLSSNLNIQSKIELDLTLARGLNYYTGAIFEVKANHVEMGSICGGGRYDDLTGIFGLKDVSGVGISFGADRIYDVLQQLNRFQSQNLNNVKLMFANFGELETVYCMKMLEKVRKAGINAELYPDAAKMKKQFSYADSKEIKFVAIVGENEMQVNKVSLKNMTTGEQKTLSVEEMIEVLKNN